MSKHQTKSKEQGKGLTSSAPTFFPLQLLKPFTVSLSLLGHFPHQTNESPNRRLTKMFTFGNKLSVKVLVEKTSHSLPLLFNQIIWERQGSVAGVEMERQRKVQTTNKKARAKQTLAILFALRSLTSLPLPSCS